MEFRAFMPSVEGRIPVGMGFGTTPTTNPNCSNWSNGAVDNSTCESTLSLVGPWNDIRECPGWVGTLSSDNSTIIFKNYVYVEWTDVMENKTGNIRTHRTLLAVTLSQERDVIVESTTVPLTMEQARLLLTRIAYVPPGIDGVRSFEIAYTVVSPCPLVAYFKQVNFALPSPDNSTTTPASISYMDSPLGSVGYQTTSSIGTCGPNQRYTTHTGTLVVIAPATCWADSVYNFTFANISPAFTNSPVSGTPFSIYSVMHVALPNTPNTGRDGLVFSFNGTHSDYNQGPNNGTYTTNNIFAWNDVVYFSDSTFPRVRKIENGSVITIAGSTSAFVDGAYATAKFTAPEDIVVDKTSGVIYVADNGRVRRLFNGTVSTIAGTGTSVPFPGRKMQIDGVGNLYFINGSMPDGVSALKGNRIVKLTRTNNVWSASVLAGSTTFATTDGNGTAASFAFVSSIAVSNLGIAYALEFSQVNQWGAGSYSAKNMLLRKITPDGMVTSLTEPYVSGTSSIGGIVTNDAGNMVWFTDEGRVWQMWPMSGTDTSLDDMKSIASSSAYNSQVYIQGKEGDLKTDPVAKFPFILLTDMAFDNGRLYVVRRGTLGEDNRIAWIGVAFGGQMETGPRETPVLFKLQGRVEDGFNFCASDLLNASVSASLSTIGNGPFSVGGVVNFGGNLTTSGLPPAQIFMRAATIYNTKPQYESAGRYPKAIYQSATDSFSPIGTSTAFKAKFVDSLGTFFAGTTSPEAGGWTSVSSTHLQENTDPSIYLAGVPRPFLAQVTVVGGPDLTSSYLVPADFGTIGNGFSLELRWRVYYDLTSASLGQRKRSDIQYVTSRQTEHGFTVYPTQAGDVTVESTARISVQETFSQAKTVSTGLSSGAIAGIAVAGVALICTIVSVAVLVNRKRRTAKEPETLNKGLFMTTV
jgi:hypothetical protein